MDDSVLWAVALGTAALGLLLLTVAGVVAMYLNTRARGAGDVTSADKSQPRAKDVASTDKSQSRAKDVASTDKSQSHVDSSSAKHAIGGGFLIWLKAWIFALVHAGTVSLVLGGVTFFEDIAKASDEIQRTGTVTFPKQLLPGTLTGSISRKRLSQPSGDSGDLDQPRVPPSNTAGWEVVDLLDETDAAGDG